MNDITYYGHFTIKPQPSKFDKHLTIYVIWDNRAMMDTFVKRQWNVCNKTSLDKAKKWCDDNPDGIIFRERLMKEFI
jgi:hypothetical protein